MFDQGLIARLDVMIAERHLLEHPFYQDWSAGRLSRETLREYAAQYYRHVEAFPRYLSAIHSRCDDLGARQAILENLIDEERGADNHPELWLRFGEGLGIAREQVIATPPAPETRNLVATFNRLAREAPVAAGLAALYVYEAQIPAVAATKIDGLKRYYGVTDARTIEFFTAHQETDVYHARVGAELIERLAPDTAGADAVVQAADAALSALWAMLYGVQARAGSVLSR